MIVAVTKGSFEMTRGVWKGAPLSVTFNTLMIILNRWRSERASHNYQVLPRRP